MIRAVVQNGAILPLDPLPADWADGQELVVGESSETAAGKLDNLDQWAADLEIRTSQIPVEDFERLDAALAEADKQAKTLVRREMGL